eukprot:TRINITY_DN3911_c0_g1_i2.p1 TRINITY_DN3911_c0_g1~~TRINITY_DN3911_c0_g1_i2.p1  ORF type:complete len:238 (+),score=55.52 TRINITY_DN3911_c0_g1_i2:490-1203(+)
MYPHLVINFAQDDRIKVNINLEEFKDKLPESHKLKEVMKGKTHKVFRRIFRELTGKDVHMPGTFKSHGNLPAVKCTLKRSSGALYPLEIGFFFIHNPATFIPLSDISSVEFARVSSGPTNTTRTFDIIINGRSSGEHQFSSLQRQEFTPLYHFVKEKKLKIRVANASDGSTQSKIVEMEDDGGLEESDSDDDDFAPVEEDAVAEEFDEMDAVPINPELDVIDKASLTSKKRKRGDRD